MADQYATDKDFDGSGSGRVESSPESVPESLPERFDAEAPTKRLNDVKKGLIPLLVVIVAYLGLEIYCIGIDIADWSDVSNISQVDTSLSNSTSSALTSRDTGDDTKTSNDTRWMFVAASVLAFTLTFGLMFFIRYLPHVTIWLGPSLCLVMIVVELGFSIYRKVWILAAFLGVALLFFAVLFYLMLSRIKLSGELLKTANIAADGHRPQGKSLFAIKRAYLVVILGLFAQLGLTILNVSIVIAILFRFEPNHAGCSSEGACGWGLTFTLCVLAIWIHNWLSSVLTNALLMINAGGTFSPWYFEDSGFGTRRAFKLATTRSLGSIAWGSLLVGIVELLHKIIQVLDHAMSSNCCTACCCRLLSCFTMLLKKLIEKFNRYVYIFIAVGHPGSEPYVAPFKDDFTSAARHTLRFFGYRDKHDPDGARWQGISSLVDDSIVELSLKAAAFVTALLCVAFTYLYMYVIDDNAVSDHSYDWVILVYAFLLAHTICLLLTSALDAGVSTIFVCISQDATPLERKAPDLFKMIVENQRYQAIFPGVSRAAAVSKNSRRLNHVRNLGNVVRHVV